MHVFGILPLQKRDIISFPVELAKIKEKLVAHGQQIHPIQLDKVQDSSDPQGKGGTYWIKRTAIAFGFPLGRPLSRSGGAIVEYIQPTGQLVIK